MKQKYNNSNTSKQSGSNGNWTKGKTVNNYRSASGSGGSGGSAGGSGGSGGSAGGSSADDYRLNDEWVMYDHEKSNNQDYEKSTRILGTFNTVGEYLFLKSKFPKPSDLFYQKDIGKNYYSYEDHERDISAMSIFRKGVYPKWEDPSNINGGELSLRKFNKRGLTLQECMNEYWETITTNVIAEQFKQSQYITGVRIVDSSILASKKQVYRIEIWFSTLNARISIQQDLKDLFYGILITDLYFREHKSIDISQPLPTILPTLPTLPTSLPTIEQILPTTSPVFHPFTLPFSLD